jgi:hypothetical protein
MVKQALFTLLCIVSLLLQSCVPPFVATSSLPTSQRPVTKPDATLDDVDAQTASDKAPTPPSDTAAAPAQPTAQGVLRLPIELAIDADPTTNPTEQQPVPVVRIASPKSAQAIHIAEITLGVEVTPHHADQNPAGTVVTFRLWNANRSVDLAEQVAADAWGAAVARFSTVTTGPYFYQASTVTFGQTPIRSFRIDPAQTFAELQLEAAQLTTHITEEGQLVAEVASSFGVENAPTAIELIIMRQTPPTHAGERPQLAFLPSHYGRRIDATHGQVAAWLEPGDYLVQAKAVNGKIRAFTSPQQVQIPENAAARLAALRAAQTTTEPSGIGADGLVYRQLANRQPASSDADGERGADTTKSTLVQTWREGAFRWRTTTYSTTLETIVDDGKKRVTLDDFAYDPVARRYTIGIQSLMTTTVQDKVTVEVLGPNGVVIYEETAPILLEAGKTLHHSITVPTDRGEPLGLRVHVHDPSLVAGFIETAKTTVYALFDYIVSSTGLALEPGFSLTIRFEVAATVIGIEIMTVGGKCTSGLQCTFFTYGAVFQADPVAYILPRLEQWVFARFQGPTVQTIINSLGQGIPLGGTTVKGIFTGRYTLPLLDASSCISPAYVPIYQRQIAQFGFQLDLLANQVNNRLANSAKSFQGKDFKIPLGPAPFPLNVLYLGWKGYFKGAVQGGSTPATDGILLEFGPEAGVEGMVILQPFDPFILATGAYKAAVLAVAFVELFDAAYGLYNIFTFIRDLKNFKPAGNCAPGGSGGGGGRGGSGGRGGGGSNPPPPNGHPDDRHDAIELEFLPEPTGVSGNVQALTQQLALAQAQGLTRAAKYFTYLLRQQEQNLFLGDTQRRLAYTAELRHLAESATFTTTALYSGTILPPPGQTITDAVAAIYDQTVAAFNNTSYDQELATLRAALDFAERQYFALRGQELELQLELRKLSGGIGVLDTGLWSWAMAAIGTIGASPKLIHILPGEASDAYTAEYMTPVAAPPVVFVPTGGLNRYQGSEQARAWLEEYVASGGTLIVLTQYENEDWKLLPGGQVEGVGYKDDILCKEASVHIVNPSVWITGLDQDFPNIQIDGSFTRWPSNATILWQRRTGNQMPAMLEYNYGAGQVVATAAYPDFYINGMQSVDDITFARSLFSIAYLRANNETVAATVAPNTPLAFNVPINNVLGTPLTQVMVTRDAYDRRIADAWRWAAHAPNLGSSAGTQTFVFSPTLPAGATQSVNFAFSAPNRAGIYRVGAVPFSLFGVFPSFGPFYQVRSAAVAVDLFNARLTQNQADYGVGETAMLTVTLRNDQPLARTFVITPELGLSGPVITLNAGPNQTVTKVYTTPVTGFREVRLRVGANGRLLSTLVTTLRLRRPTLGITVSPERIAAHATPPVGITVTARDAKVGSPVEFTVTRGASFVLSTTVPLAAVGGYLAAVANVTLPAAGPGVEYRIRAELDDPGCGLFTCAIKQTAAVVPVASLRGLHYTSVALNFGQSTPNALLALLNGSEFAGVQRVQSMLRTESGAILSVGVPVQSAVSTTPSEALLDLPLPNALPLDQPLHVVALLTTRADGATLETTTALSVPFTLVPPVFTVLEAERFAGDPLTMQLYPPRLAEINQPLLLPATSPLTVTVLGPQDSLTQTFVINNPTVVDGRFDFSINLPATLTRGGLYQVLVASRHLTGWVGNTSFRVPETHFTFDSLGTVVAGQPLAFALRNQGGVDTRFDGTVSLISTTGATLAMTPVNAPVSIRAAIASNLEIPTQIRAGRYEVRAVGVDHLGQRVVVSAQVIVAGLETTLTVSTDQVAYLTTDQVQTTSVINTNLPLEGATLRLRVIKSGGLAPVGDWRGPRADSGNSNRVGASFGLPLSQGWSAPHSPFPAGNALAVGGLIITVESSQQRIQARDGAGQLLWERAYDSYGFSVQSLVANSTRLFALVDTTVVALDVVSGAVQWSQWIGSGVSAPLLVTDTALAVLFTTGGGGTTFQPGQTGKGGLAAPLPQIGTSDGYILLDPARGAERGLIPQTTPAALVGGRLYLLENAAAVAAYDTNTAAQVWSTRVSTFLEVIAANGSYVLALDGGTRELHLFNAADGAFLRTIQLDSNFVTGDGQQSFVLDGATFTYATTLFGAGSNGLQLSRVELAAGAQTPLYTNDAFDFRALIGAGNQLYLLREGLRSLITLDAQSGGDLGEIDLSALTAGALSGLLAGPRGPIIVTDADIITLLESDIGGGDSSAEQILREDLLPVNGSDPLTLDFALINPPLADDPNARGQLYLEGTLFAREPQSVADPTARQFLARSRTSFHIDDSSAALTLVVDQAALRQNIAGYGADDALSTATLRGLVRNTSPLASDVTVTVSRSDGATLFNQTYAGLAPDGVAEFTLADATPPTGVVTYTAASSLGGGAITRLIVRPPDLAASVTWTPTLISLGEATTAVLVLQNRHLDLPGVVTVNWGDGQETIVLDQAQTVTLTHRFTPTQPGIFNPPVLLSGDASGPLSAANPVTVRDESVTVTSGLDGVLRTPTALVLTADAAITFTVRNNGSETFDVAVTYLVNSPSLNGAATFTLAPLATQMISVPLNALTLGAHSALFTVTHARTGRVLGTATLAFDLVVAQTFITLQAQVGEPAPDLSTPIAISVTSAAASDLPWRGVLVVEGTLNTRSEFTVNPGATYRTTPLLDLADRAGGQPVIVTLIGPEGAIVAQRSFTVNGALRQASAAQLVSLSATAGTAGSPVILTATVNNPGPAGEAVFTFSAFDQTLESVATLPADSTTQVTQTIPVPAGLIDGRFPAAVQLGAQLETTDIAVSGAQLALSQSLDAALYQPFAEATYGVQVRALSGAPAQYDVTLRYAGAEFVQTVTVGAGDTANIAWVFNVGQVSDRATVLVRNRPATPTAQSYTLVIDSSWVAVLEDDRAYLASDRTRYNAGETVNLTIHLLKPVNSAFVLAPGDVPTATGFLAWSSLEPMNATGIYTSAIGTFNAAYHLPPTMRTGRYFFRLFYDGEERTLPVDVLGVNLLVEGMTVETTPLIVGNGAHADVQTTIRADVRLNQPVPDALIEAYALTPNGDYRALGQPTTRSFSAGVTPLTVTGVFTSEQSGPHQVIFKVRDAATLALLGGEARFVDVGSATITDLTTDQGVYTPGSPASGAISLFNSDTATVVVRTSGGTVLLNQTIAARGHQTLRFTPPTATPMDEVLIGAVTDSRGLTSTRQRAYKVAASLDSIAPQVQILTPAPSFGLDTAMLEYTTPDQRTITVSGIVTENASLANVTVNGVLATVTGNTWSAPLTLQRGVNFIEVVAMDTAGNVGNAVRSVLAEPSYGVSLELAPATLAVGEVIQVRAVITAADAISAVVTFPFSSNGFAPTSGSATDGQLNLTLSPDNPTVSWQGQVAPGAPVTIVWSATVSTPQSGSAYALANAESFDARISNPVAYGVSGVVPTATATATPTGTPTATPINTPTPTNTPTNTPTATPTNTPVPGATNTPTPTPTNTPTTGVLIASCGGYQVYQLPGGSYTAPGWHGRIIVGTAGNDRMRGTGADELILGLGGNDRIEGRGGADVICGGAGNDWLIGGNGNELLDGGPGNDKLNGSFGFHDVLIGGEGNDLITDPDGASIVSGGPGSDVIGIVYKNGWKTPAGQRQIDGITAGYGNDSVNLALGGHQPYLLTISGDEYDDPTSPLEGLSDSLLVIGPVDSASRVIKFERQAIRAASGELAFDEAQLETEWLLLADETAGSQLFLPVVVR